MILNIASIIRAGAAKVTVSGATIQDFAGNTQAAIRFNSDGTTDSQVNNGTFTQINDTTDWVIPNAKAPGVYEVFATQTSGDAVAGSALDTWLALTSNRTWDLSGTGKTAVLNISVRIGSSTLDTGEYTLDTQP